MVTATMARHFAGMASPIFSQESPTSHEQTPFACRKRARTLLLRLGYTPSESSAPPSRSVQKKPKSTVKLRKPTRRGVAGGTRARLRADKARRSSGGAIQAEPLPPPSWNIPGTDIPDRSRSEDAKAGNDLQETDRDMKTELPDPNIDSAMTPRVDPQFYPGIVNTPIRGSHRPRSMAPFRK